MNNQTRRELIELAKRVGATEVTFCHASESADDDFDPDDLDRDSETEDGKLGVDECGQQSDGACLLAGTEECDFECPFRGEEDG